MPIIEIDGKKIEVDEDGYLIDYREWNEKLAEFMAEKDGIKLTDAHWEIIRFVKDYYLKFQVSPMLKILVKELWKAFGEQKGNTKYVYELFPAGPAKTTNRYAGNPPPCG